MAELQADPAAPGRLQVRLLQEHEWDEAMGLTARAFTHEPFVVSMFGADPVARFPRVTAMYRSTPWTPDGDHLGAFAADCLVGAIGVERAGRCFKCRASDDSGLYGRNVAAAHRREQADHGWIGRVAVEPCLQGFGIGGRLLDGAVQRLREVGTTTALLDAEVHRESYYAARGFTTVEHFTGSFDNTLALMRWSAS